MAIRFVLALLFMALVVPAWADDIPDAALAWARGLGREVVGVDVSPEGKCLAVATTTGLAVLKADGQPVWDRPFPNPWLAASTHEWWGAKALAVAPDCRWLAVAGGPGYRYVWLFGPHGEPRKHISTPGTPKAVAISHNGEVLAVGTAAGHLLLIDSRGATQKDITLPGFSSIIHDLQFSPSDALVLTSEAGGTTALLTKLGEVLWTRRLGFWMTTEVSQDWERFLVVGLPGHGHMVGDLELVTRDGRTLWQRSVLNPAVGKTPDSRNFVVSSLPSEDEAGASTIMPRTVLDRDGNVVLTGDP